jgi:hypothetical protein
MQTAEEILHKHIDKKSMDEISVNIWPDMIEAMKLYAIEKVKEALQLAAERATCDDVSMNAMPEYEVNKQSILSLETEILEQINKEG